jgi:hypothetical protein
VKKGPGSVDPVTKVTSLVGGFALIIAMVSGAIALFGISRHGRRGLLWPALAGLLPWVLLVVVAIPGFLDARRQALAFPVKPRTGEMLPVETLPGANRIRHSTLGFSFDVPGGFDEIPLTKSLAKFWKLFGKPALPGDLAEVFGVQLLGTRLPRRHLDPSLFPPGAHATLSRLSWRGVEVDAIRLSETTDGKNYVSYNIQIPLRGEAIQLMLGAPTERETELKARIQTLLASLDGPSDW